MYLLFLNQYFDFNLILIYQLKKDKFDKITQTHFIKICIKNLE